MYNLDGMVMWKKKVDEGEEHKINGLSFFQLDGQLCLAVCHASATYIEILTAESGSLITTVKGRSIIVEGRGTLTVKGYFDYALLFKQCQ